jgi:tryptophan-rich sensory protein
MPLFKELPDWKPISRLAGIAWLVVYLLFLLYAAADRTGFLFVDYVNLIIHEGGHMVFSPFGYTIRILGGTLGELIVPLLCAAYFWWKRETSAVAFCSFWFFENFLYIGTYMSDARTSALPLVGSDESDWTILFGQWGVLIKDQQIGHSTRLLGWLGMFATLAWLSHRVYLASQPKKHFLT